MRDEETQADLVEEGEPSPSRGCSGRASRLLAPPPPWLLVAVTTKAEMEAKARKGVEWGRGEDETGKEG